MARRSLLPLVVLVVVVVVGCASSLVRASAAGARGVGIEGASMALLASPLARCLDGTQAGFYLAPGNATDIGAEADSELAQQQPGQQQRFVLHLEGGGECATKASCQSRLATSMGSSKYFPATRDLWGLLSSSPEVNPDFYGATRVLLPYCSGDLWSGNVSEPSPSTFGMYFAGHLTIGAMLDELVASYGLVDSPSTLLVLSGDSAGGIGTWINVDAVAARFPSSTVVAASYAGFYFTAYPYTGINATESLFANFTADGLVQAYELWQSVVDDDCAQAMTARQQQQRHAVDGGLAVHPTDIAHAALCLLANNSYPYVTSPAFAFESQTDQVVLTAHDSIPNPPDLCGAPELAYVREWTANMTAALGPLMASSNARNGVFNPSCWFHVGFYEPTLTIQGISPMEAFGNWIFQRTGPEGWKLQDVCSEGQAMWCNPTCGPDNPRPCPSTLTPMGEEEAEKQQQILLDQYDQPATASGDSIFAR